MCVTFCENSLEEVSLYVEKSLCAAHLTDAIAKPHYCVDKFTGSYEVGLPRDFMRLKDEWDIVEWASQSWGLTFVPQRVLKHIDRRETKSPCEFAEIIP